MRSSKRHDHLHHMFDQQDADAFFSLILRTMAITSSASAGRKPAMVSSSSINFGLCCQRPGDLQALAPGNRQPAGYLPVSCWPSPENSSTSSAFASATLRVIRACISADHHIIQHGDARERPNHLKGARQAQFADLIGP